MDIHLNGRKITNCFLLISALLTAVNILLIVLLHKYHHDHVFGLRGMFNFQDEGIIPSFFSGFLFIFSSLLCFVTTQACRQNKNQMHCYWFFLSLIFFYLAMDETLQFHERLSVYLKNTWPSSGLFYFPWVIPYGIFVIILGLVYIRFLKALPPSTAKGILIAGLVYLSGALGMEMAGGWIISVNQGSYNTLAYSIAALFEEVLEFLGLIILIRVITNHLQKNYPNLALRFVSA